jgi:diaminobutyrate-2-oxoglutarate transaminase
VPSQREEYAVAETSVFDNAGFDNTVFEELESEVRNYCRWWPAVFVSARDCHIYDERGRGYLDFFSGAGALNYGHNNPHLKEALLGFLGTDAIVHGLDMYTPVKRRLLEALRSEILAPRGLDFKVQFSGPAGALAVEAAFKLARKYTGRQQIVSFTNSFHGMTLETLTVTGRPAPGAAPGRAVVLPYDQPPGPLALEQLIDERGAPAAVIVETVQGEGGMYAASPDWLRQLAELCRRSGVLLIVDDVQMGCGRTGPFFSFEVSGIHPDIVCVSKSISGYGLPLALTLIRPELDIWSPGEHSGTFRGFNPAFATAIAALDFWRDGTLEKQTLSKGEVVEQSLRRLADDYPGAITHARGRGLAWGLAFAQPRDAQAVRTRAFELGLIVETCGSSDQVIKLLPPLTIGDEDLTDGLGLLADAVRAGVHR